MLLMICRVTFLRERWLPVAEDIGQLLAQSRSRLLVALVLHRGVEHGEVSGVVFYKLHHNIDQMVSNLPDRQTSGDRLDIGPVLLHLVAILNAKGANDRFLVGKVLIDRADGCIGALGDLGHGGGIVACLGENDGSGFQQLRDATLGTLLLRDASLV